MATWETADTHPTEANKCTAGSVANLASLVIAYANSGDNSDIYLIHGDGSGQVQLTFNSANDGAPTWSPNGQWIAYVSEQADGVYQLAVMRPDGTGERFLLPNGIQVGQWSEASTTEPRRQLLTPDSATGVQWYKWSPDSGKIALFGVQGDTDYIFVVDLEDPSPEVLATGATYLGTSITWSPDSQHIAYTAALDYSAQVQRIHVAHLDGSEATIIETDSFLERDARWHPFQQLLTFVSVLQPGLSQERLDLVAPDGGNRVTLTVSDGLKTDIEWSASGNAIAYGETTLDVSAGPPVIANRSILLLSPQGGVPEVLIEGVNVDVSNFRWSPKDCFLAYLAIRGETYDLKAIDVNDHTDSLVVSNVDYYAPSWKPLR